MRTLTASLLATSLLAACGTETESSTAKDAPPAPLVMEDGKSDVADRVQILGALGADEPVTGAFEEDLQLDAYTALLRAGSTVDIEVTHRGTAARLDTTLYVFGPRQAGGGFGGSAIAFDDDSGWGLHSRLRGLQVEAGGEYLVVVGTYSNRARGHYRLLMTCPDGACEGALPEPPAQCPAGVADGVRACADAWIADASAEPGTPVPDAATALDGCLDAEPFAEAWDAWCGATRDPSCQLPYEVAYEALRPLCAAAVAPPTGCVFGARYFDLDRTRGLSITGRETLTASTPLDGITARQIVTAVRQSAFDDLEDVDAAFGFVDAGEINKVTVWDETGGRVFEVYEYGAGDNSFGGYFAAGSPDLVASIADGDVSDCRVAPGPRVQACAENADCGEGLRCMGAFEGAGRCQDPSVRPGDGAPCTSEMACPGDGALWCAGEEWGEGFCLPAWMQDHFADEPADGYARIPDGDDGGLVRTVRVDGLATVSMGVRIRLEVQHDAPSQLRVTLTNPIGTEAVIPVGEARGWIDLDTSVMGFPGDEDVNGDWQLRIVDESAGSTGVLYGWTLTVGSRWD